MKYIYPFPSKCPIIHKISSFQEKFTSYTINHENFYLNKKKQSTDANIKVKTELPDDDFKAASIKMLQWAFMNKWSNKKQIKSIRK